MQLQNCCPAGAVKLMSSYFCSWFSIYACPAPGEYLCFSLLCKAEVKLVGVWSVTSGRALLLCACEKEVLDTAVVRQQQQREVVPFQGVLGYPCPTHCPLDQLLGCSQCCSCHGICRAVIWSESKRRLWWGAQRHFGPHGWGRVKRSFHLGHFCFLLLHWCSQHPGCRSGLASCSQTGYVREVLAKKKSSVGIP